MRRVVLAALLAATAGCVSQRIVRQEFYEPTAETLRRREDGHWVGALKSETVKSGAPDWSGDKSFSVIGIGN